MSMTPEDWAAHVAEYEARERTAMAEADSVVIVVRDPDASNDYTVLGRPVYTYDVDCGYMNLDDPEEFADWAENHRASAKQMRESGNPLMFKAADQIESIVEQYEGD
jgi:hypothetical protein